jgi:hypothetical protein
MSTRPSAEPSVKLSAALDRCDSLSLLLRRLQESRAHFDAIAPLLPPTLRADIRPGPVDAVGWTLLAAHNAAAAKLRQMLPTLLHVLRQGGWQGNSIKVRVQPRETSI